MKKLKILYIDDETAAHEALADYFSVYFNEPKNKVTTSGYEIIYDIGHHKLYCVQSKKDAIKLVADVEFDLAFIDYELGNNIWGHDVGKELELIYEKFYHGKLHQVMLTAYKNEQRKALHSRVFFDYLTKPVAESEFSETMDIFNSFYEEINKLIKENEKLRSELHDTRDKLLKTFDITATKSVTEDKRFGLLDRNIIGESNEVIRVKRFIQKYADTDDNVLIIGETGTGKDLVAEAIHKLSGRSSKPFIPINCASIPEELMESELFGHTRDAFTGATRERIGKFEEANGGSVFLDEIDRMSIKAQAKILRFLEDKKVIRLGQQDNQGTVVDVRIIAAIKPKAIHTIGEKFLEDLYGRLQSLFPVIPSLNVRKDDIPLLVEHFIDLIGYNSARVYKGGENGKLSEKQYPLSKYLQEYKDRKLFHFDDEGLRLMKDYEWRRNVRELRKFIENIFSVFVDNKISWNNQLIPADDVKRAFIFHKIEIPISEDDKKLLDDKYSNKKFIKPTRKINLQEVKYIRAMEVIKMLNNACSRVIESANNKSIAYNRIIEIEKNINKNKLNQIKKYINAGDFDNLAVIGLFCKSKTGKEGMAFEGIYDYLTQEFFDLYDTDDKSVLSVIGDTTPLRVKLDSTLQNQRVKKISNK